VIINQLLLISLTHTSQWIVLTSKFSVHLGEYS
jgi:hypothetical protein